jgi:hypothetical protein
MGNDRKRKNEEQHDAEPGERVPDAAVACEQGEAEKRDQQRSGGRQHERSERFFQDEPIHSAFFRVAQRATRAGTGGPTRDRRRR